MRRRQNSRPVCFPLHRHFLAVCLVLVTLSVQIFARIIPASEVDSEPMRFMRKERATSSEALAELENLLVICDRIRKYSTQASSTAEGQTAEGLVGQLCKHINRTRTKKARRSHAWHHNGEGRHHHASERRPIGVVVL